MNAHSSSAAASAAPLALDCATDTPAACNPCVERPAAGIIAAASLLLPHLEAGRRVDAADLRAAMETAFGASDAAGARDWKSAYEACEVASVLFLRQYGQAILRKAGSPAAALPLIGKIGGLLPTHTRRSQESVNLQQFSTPLPLGLAVLAAAGVRPADIVLESSVGTGLLAIFAELAGARLILNEFAQRRAELLSFLFPACSVTRFDAAQIDDHLDASLVPSVVMTNPPFSALAHVAGRMQDAGFRHVFSALKRLAPGGRLVAITGANLDPALPEWRGAFVRLQERGRVVFGAAIAGSVYAKHGTSFPTRLTVIDQTPAEDPEVFPASPGVAPDVATLLGWIGARVPKRLPVDPSVARAAVFQPPCGAQAPGARKLAPSAPCKPALGKSTLSTIDPAGVPLAYETLDWTPPGGARLSEAIYEGYGLQSIRIPGSAAHPTKLVQSAAMASVAPPKPGYRPLLPATIHALLSDAQLETVIYAGEAHAGYLAGSWTVDETFDLVAAAARDAPNAVRFRRGFMLGDGTGAGKGRHATANRSKAARRSPSATR